MLNLPLAPTDDRANPAFKDAASCAQWLGQLQLTNLHLVHGVIRTQLDELNRYPMLGLERLRILELLRETVAHLQADYARKLTARKLPLSEEEFTILVSITALWQFMVSGYQRCLQSLLAGDKQLVAYSSMLCQRCLLYTGLQIFEYLRNGYEFEGGLWQQLHTLYAFCEEQGWQLEEVSVLKQHGSSGKGASKFNELAGGLNSRSVSCHAIYVGTLLTCYVYPGELSRGQSQLLDRWLLRWSAAIPLERRYAISKGDAPPLAVDLAGSRGLQPLSQISAAPSQANQNESDMRYLAMVPLSKLLQVKTILLQQGQSPQQLELGEGCSSADCTGLLKFLHRRWCEGSGERMPSRCSVELPARVCYGLEDIYTHIANKSFKPPVRDTHVDSLARSQIATFGRVLSEDSHRSPTDSGHALEAWQISDESILGARMLREGTVGARIGMNQIVAVRPANANVFILGTIRWVQVTLTGQLSAGVRYLPGVAQAVAIKAAGVSLGASDNSAAALLLPDVPALKTPSSLVIPRDWFTPGRVIEIIHPDNQKLKVKMALSVESGVDYERVSFTPVY